MPSIDGIQAPNPAESLDQGWRARLRLTAAGCRHWLRRPRRPGATADHPSHPRSPLEELRPPLDAMVAEAAGLPGLASELEGRFLAVAACLDELPGVSDALVQHAHRLVAIATGQGPGNSIYQATYDRLEGPLKYVDAHWATLRGVRQHLVESSRAIDDMLTQESALSHTVAPLKFIQTLFKVESAGLDPALQSMFLALTEEISGLQRKVSETFGEKFQILRDIRRVLASVEQDLKQQDARAGVFLADRKKALETTLSELRSDLEQNQRREVKLTQVGQCVADKVGVLVFGLQAQDIVAQKTAHVIAAIGTMAERFASREADPARQGALLRYLSQAATVQQAQIQSIRADLRQTEDQLTEAISTIEDQVGQLDAESISLSEFDRITVAYDGLIETLLDVVGGVYEMVDTTVASTEQVFAAIKPLGGRTTNVTETMRELSAHIRVIALNAQVQAARIDNGTGLEVLAAATNRVAVETGGISEEVATRLDRFSTTLDALVQAFVRLHDEGVAEQQSCRERSASQRVGLHEVRDAALAELHQTAQCADRIRELVTGMQKKVAVSSLADARLGRPRESLVCIAALAHELLRQPAYASLRAEARPDLDLVPTYTMESERLVHEAALAAEDGAPAPGGDEAGGDAGTSPGPAASPRNQLTGLAAPAESAAMPGAAVSDGSKGSDGSDGSGSAGSNGTPAGEPEAKKEFGDNVDLF